MNTIAVIALCGVVADIVLAVMRDRSAKRRKAESERARQELEGAVRRDQALRDKAREDARLRQVLLDNQRNPERPIPLSEIVRRPPGYVPPLGAASSQVPSQAQRTPAPRPSAKTIPPRPAHRSRRHDDDSALDIALQSVFSSSTSSNDSGSSSCGSSSSDSSSSSYSSSSDSCSSSSSTD